MTEREKLLGLTDDDLTQVGAGSETRDCKAIGRAGARIRGLCFRIRAAWRNGYITLAEANGIRRRLFPRVASWYDWLPYDIPADRGNDNE